MIINIQNFKTYRTNPLPEPYYPPIYSDKSVHNFSNPYAVEFTPTFHIDDASTQVSYILQMWYSLPNSNTWSPEYAVHTQQFSHRKVSGETVYVLSTLTDVEVTHREAGTRYRWELTSTESIASTVSTKSDCLFVPPALYLMNPQNNWVVGQPYIRIGNEWKEVKTVFVYKDGNWHESIIS